MEKKKKKLCLSCLLKERKCLYEIVDIFIKFVQLKKFAQFVIQFLPMIYIIAEN